MTNDKPTMSLHRKLAQIMAEAERIPKRGTAPVAMGGFPFVQVGDAADFIRKALAEKVISMLPTHLAIVGQNERATKSGGSMTTVDIIMDWTLTDGESGETITIQSFGAGGDSGDKYSGKAQTNAMKYALLMGFLLSTGDDPELASADHLPAGVDGARGAARVTKSSQPGVQRGGRSGIATSAQITAIGTAARELGFHVADLRAYIEATLKVPVPEEPEKIKAFMAELTSGQAGQLVAGLRELLATQATGSSDPDPKGPQGDMARDAVLEGEDQPSAKTAEQDDFELA